MSPDISTSYSAEPDRLLLENVQAENLIVLQVLLLRQERQMQHPLHAPACIQACILMQCNTSFVHSMLTRLSLLPYL